MRIKKLNQILCRIAMILCGLCGGLWLIEFIKEPSRYAVFHICLMAFCVAINIPGAFFLYKYDSNSNKT